MTMPPTVRCAIYTRKSTDEGLDQGFNSLDAQHEACAAFVASQKQEGWILAKDRFDDGGLSGGTLERPGLQRLLAEIDAGRITMIVVYKIDRLTRSLADFAKLVERLDARGCSFVSVTQSFNTATSMGRLTLNVLLSFAQFEREVTAERIRDKIAASKKKGLWMGGIPPLGYDRPPDPKVRELAVNLAEAKTVQTLFELCERLQNLARVEREADALGLRSKHHLFRSGREQGGNPLSRGQIHKILTNPVYIGKIRHKDLLWPGCHRPIVDVALWDRVQRTLQTAAARPRGRGNVEGIGRRSDPASLIGKLRDETGDRLTPTHTLRRGERLRYYVSNRLLRGVVDPSGWRLPAPKLEAAIRAIIADHIAAKARTHSLLSAPDLREDDALRARVQAVIATLRGGDDTALLRSLLVVGKIGAGTLTLTLDAATLCKELEIRQDRLASDVLSIAAPFALRRRGIEMKLLAGQPIPSPDPALRKALADAHRWTQALKSGNPLHEIARTAGHHDAYIRTRAPLAFLSLPLDWSEQELLCGF
ncbi:MAG: recombinase family protein [Paracoccaceae bacterium]